jgi:hypothetical protein
MAIAASKVSSANGSSESIPDPQGLMGAETPISTQRIHHIHRVPESSPSGLPVQGHTGPLHMIEEYPRHNGHADLIRESVDGETGE